VKPREAIAIYDAVEKEGFESAFVDYSDFSEIADQEFHNKREAYLKNRAALIEYLGLEGKVST
jgi:hypothetical protein